MRTRTPAALCGLAALAGSLAGCSGPWAGDDQDTHHLEVRAGHTAFDVEVPQGWAITDVRDTDPCGVVSYRVAEDGEARLVVQAVPTACAEAGADHEIGNGFHGLYRTLDDVPDPKRVTTVDTDLGSASVFTQSYYECTNSCQDWDEPVAIVTVDDPVDAAYPTLVLRGDRDHVGRADFETVVATLAPPYVPTTSTS